MIDTLERGFDIMTTNPKTNFQWLDTKSSNHVIIPSAGWGEILTHQYIPRPKRKPVLFITPQTNSQNWCDAVESNTYDII